MFCRNLFVKFNLGGLNLTGHFEENVKEQDEYDRELEAEKEATDNYADDFEEMDESEEQVVPPAPEIESPSIPSSTNTHNISSVDVKSQKTNFSGAPFQTLQQQNSAQPSAPFRTFATATTGGSRSQPSQHESSQQESKMSMMSTNSDDASRLQSFMTHQDGSQSAGLVPANSHQRDTFGKESIVIESALNAQMSGVMSQGFDVGKSDSVLRLTEQIAEEDEPNARDTQVSEVWTNRGSGFSRISEAQTEYERDIDEDVDPELKQNTEANKGQATKSSSKNRPPREKQDPTPEISQAIGAPGNQSIRY